jgi:ubiquinone biosynthesis protein
VIRLFQILRLIHINFVLVRHGLDEVILATHLFRPIRFIAYLLPWTWMRTAAPRGVRIRRVLEELGPIFVKFGQILSTRADLLPEDIAVELAKLQDRVPPFPGRIARGIIERELRSPISKVFAEFEETPLASASIAQVHAAQLPTGEEVVVKVVRPGITQTIARDVSLLFTLAGLAERYWPDGRRLHPVDVVREFDKTIHDELDLMREAANAAQLRRNFEDSDILYIPEVNWELTRTNVMVMERIYGIPISDVAGLVAAGVDLKAISERGVEIFFTQVFRDSFFHADMHPGNIFVDVQHPGNPRYIAVDFGIMGTLNPVDQHYLAENFLAFFNRDYRRVAELHIESGWVPPGTRVEEFEAAIRTVSEPIFGKPLKEISFGHFLLRLFQTARRFNMEVQPQLVLLQKTLLSIEGLGRRLYPELDLWQTAKPFLERWMSEQVGARSYLQRLRTMAPEWGKTLPEVPVLLHRVLTQAVERDLELKVTSRELEQIQRELRRMARRSYYTNVGAALFIAAAVLTAWGEPALGRLPLPVLILAGVGAVLILIARPRGSGG